jgi:hypothetical protein
MSEQDGRPYVMCACDGELSSSEQENAERILSPYFPVGARFEFSWLVDRTGGLSQSEWFSKLLDEKGST